MKEKLQEVVNQIVQKLASLDVGCKVRENVTLGGELYPYVISTEFSLDEMSDFGIEVYDLAKETSEVYWDWYSGSTIVVGLN